MLRNGVFAAICDGFGTSFICLNEGFLLLWGGQSGLPEAPSGPQKAPRIGRQGSPKEGPGGVPPEEPCNGCRGPPAGAKNPTMSSLRIGHIRAGATPGGRFF